MSLIRLTDETRGDVPAEVTHLVEVFPKEGETFVGYCLSRHLTWWFESNPADGPECESWLSQYRYGIPATSSDLTPAEADGLIEVCRVGLKAIDTVLAQYELFVGPGDAIANAVKAEAHDAMRFLRAALAAAGKGL